MKWLDTVKVVTNKYESHGVKEGDIGTILMSEIRNDSFWVVFSDSDGKDYAEIDIKVFDLELVKDNGVTDDKILNDLPLQNPKWWCKVENGFIMNLKGERKNTKPFEYK